MSCSVSSGRSRVLRERRHRAGEHTSTFSAASDEFQSRLSPCVCAPDRERKAAASLFLSLADAAEQPDDFVTDVENATEANLRGVSR
jgi:hypothetical protein